MGEFKAGKVGVRNDGGGNVDASVGKVSFSSEALEENVVELMEYLQRLKPAGCKGRYMRHAVLSSTMGPGVKIRV